MIAVLPGVIQDMKEWGAVIMSFVAVIGTLWGVAWRVSVAQRTLIEMTATLSTTTATLAETRTDVNRLTNEVTTLQTELRAHMNDEASLARTVERMSLDVETLRVTMGERVATMEGQMGALTSRRRRSDVA